MTPIRLFEWSTYPGEKEPPLPPGNLFEVNTSESVLREQLKTLSQKGMLSIEDLRSGTVIRSTSFVGKVSIGGLEVVIQPKIDGAQFLKLLRYAYNLRNLTLIDRADFAVTSLSFLDLLIYQLLLEATESVYRGLRREYVRNDRELALPRGKIKVNVIALRSIPASSLPCTMHDRDDNILFNRILVAGIAMATDAAESLWLRAKLNRLRTAISPAIAPVLLNRSLLQQARRHLTRLTRIYEPMLDLIELILGGQWVSLGDETQTVNLPGFLFDMNRFFQALLSRFLSENLLGLTVQDESRIVGMMRYDPQFNPNNRRSPEPRPDFVVMKGLKTLAILDAKYRDLWKRDLPRDMLYQLAIYALSQRDCRTAAILYPTTDTLASEARIVINNPIDAQSAATVILRPVNVLRLEQVISDEGFASKEAERALMAQYLAFG